MSSSLSTYLALLRLVDDASRDMGLQRLTPADKHILLSLGAFVDKAGTAHRFTYARYCDLVEVEARVSRAQFFKSLDALLDMKLVTKLGSARSSTYALAI